MNIFKIEKQWSISNLQQIKICKSKGWFFVQMFVCGEVKVIKLGWIVVFMKWRKIEM